MDIRCFIVKPSGFVLAYLRCYESTSCEAPGWSYHDARVLIGRIPRIVDKDGSDITALSLDKDSYPAEQWPTKCERCSLKFTSRSVNQIFTVSLYEDSAGKEYSFNELPVGAMYDATWLHGIKSFCGLDGRSIYVMTPGGLWCIDSQCNNCTRPNEDHKCWCRHGEPPDITVDKNGNTCSAGAGSILLGSYHGFLQNGHLTSC